MRLLVWRGPLESWRNYLILVSWPGLRTVSGSENPFTNQRVECRNGSLLQLHYNNVTNHLLTKHVIAYSELENFWRGTQASHFWKWKCVCVLEFEFFMPIERKVAVAELPFLGWRLKKLRFLSSNAYEHNTSVKKNVEWNETFGSLQSYSRCAIFSCSVEESSIHLNIE